MSLREWVCLAPCSPGGCETETICYSTFFFFQAEDGIRDHCVTGVRRVLFRSPHDDREIALRALAHAHFVKLNDHEVEVFARWLDVPQTAAALQSRLMAQFGTRSLCVTEGARGARLWHADTYVEQAAFAVDVIDTIGAGDAFLAMLLAALLRGSSPASAMARAARLAAYVASRRGAIPDYDPSQFR